MKRTYSLITAAALGSLLAGSASAAITSVHTYALGEAGSMSGGKPQDGTGSSHFGGGSIGTSTVTPSPALGSTAYATFNGTTQGNWAADLSSFATDNFAVEMWVRTSNVGQGTQNFFQLGDSGARLKLGLQGGNWAVSIHGIAWVGAANGNGQIASNNTWSHIAVIRDNGTSTLYIDGAAQAGTTAGTPVHSANAHLGVEPNGGAGNWFDGDLDELNLFTFTSGVDDPVAALSYFAVPEPSSKALLGLGGLALMLRRRR
ncbi:LamG domain-containing protein [Akkermansiaceae bacterium]|nr:LamG domain-containing protein [Akkermansiaceae bacterium]